MTDNRVVFDPAAICSSGLDMSWSLEHFGVELLLLLYRACFNLLRFGQLILEITVVRVYLGQLGQGLYCLIIFLCLDLGLTSKEQRLWMVRGHLDDLVRYGDD